MKKSSLLSFGMHRKLIVILFAMWLNPLVSSSVNLGNFTAKQKIVYQSSVDVNSLIDSQKAFYFEGISSSLQVGWTVNRHKGDINGDGIHDLIIVGYNPDQPAKIGYIIFGTKSGNFPKLDALNGANGFTIRFYDYVVHTESRHIDFIGDINGDGLDDLLVGSERASAQGAGKAYIIFGANSFSPVIDVDAPGWKGSILTDNVVSVPKFAFSHSFTGHGDFNKDGITDLAIGHWNTLPNGSNGKVYVIFGSKSISNYINLDKDLNGLNGFVIYNPNVASFGFGTASVGDVNCDGFDDLAVGGDINGGGINAGAVWIIFGQNSYPSTFSTAQLNTPGFPKGSFINGRKPGDKLGFEISTAGDFNGDGIRDLLLGARETRTGAGEAYLLFGTCAFPTSVDLSNLGSGGVIIPSTGGFLGGNLASLGDINPDGYDDIILGYLDTAIGKVHVIFGTPDHLGSEFLLTNLNGKNGFSINIPSSFAIGGVGDLNGDNQTDYAVGILSGAGKVLIITGGAISQIAECMIPQTCINAPSQYSSWTMCEPSNTCLPKNQTENIKDCEERPIWLTIITALVASLVGSLLSSFITNKYKERKIKIKIFSCQIKDLRAPENLTEDWVRRTMNLLEHKQFEEFKQYYQLKRRSDPTLPDLEDFNRRLTAEVRDRLNNDNRV